MQNGIKSRKYFSTHQYQNFRNVQHLDLSKETTKKKISRRDTLRISVATVRRCTVKKVSLEILPLVYLKIIKID